MWQRINYYGQLIRFQKPIGTFLLLWPSLSALWLAAGGVPPIHLIVIFSLGTFVMRSAGCIVNDIADRNFDKHVARTKNRPLTAGKVSVLEAFCLLALFLVAALVLVWMLNRLCLYLALIGLALTAVYPLMKRFINTPQLFLGLAFAMSVPMAFASIQNTLPLECWVFYLVAFLWPIAYDTMYAMVDKEDDLKIGIKSTAIFFGHFDKAVIALLQLLIIILLITIGVLQSFGVFYHLATTLVALLFAYQQWLIKDRIPNRCFKAFLNNQWALLVLFLGLVIPIT